MAWQTIKDKYPIYIAMIICSVLILFSVSCPPTTKSILSPDEKVTGAELQLELEALMGTAKLRLADLQRQQEFRDLIMQNALLVIESGSFNPVGILTSLFAFYGVGSAANSTRKTIVKKVEERKLAKNLNNNNGAG